MLDEQWQLGSDDRPAQRFQLCTELPEVGGLSALSNVYSAGSGDQCQLGVFH